MNRPNRPTERTAERRRRQHRIERQAARRACDRIAAGDRPELADLVRTRTT